MPEPVFDKYKKKGDIHWQEMVSRSVRKFNAYQQARYDWIIRLAGEMKGQRVLDIGCGDGALSYLLAKQGVRVSGLDNEELGLAYAKRNVPQAEFVLASAYELPFGEASFDLVVSSELIEHLEQPEKMLAEAVRVLRPGGQLILTTPHRLTEKPLDQYHTQEFFPGELEALLKRHFQEIRIYLTHHVFWYGLYTYSWRRFKNRQPGKWLINALTLWFGWNPFNFSYPKPTKRDIFTQIIAMAKK